MKTQANDISDAEFCELLPSDLLPSQLLLCEQRRLAKPGRLGPPYAGGRPTETQAVDLGDGAWIVIQTEYRFCPALSARGVDKWLPAYIFRSEIVSETEALAALRSGDVSGLFGRKECA